MSEFSQKLKFVEKDILFVLRLVAGYILIVVGFIGLLFPIVPDWILILVGIGLFDTQGNLRRKILKMLPQKYQSKVEKIILYDIYRQKDRQKN
jgi:hypothetical protein